MEWSRGVAWFFLELVFWSQFKSLRSETNDLSVTPVATLNELGLLQLRKCQAVYENKHASPFFDSALLYRAFGGHKTLDPESK